MTAKEAITGARAEVLRLGGNDVLAMMEAIRLYLGFNDGDKKRPLVPVVHYIKEVFGLAMEWVREVACLEWNRGKENAVQNEEIDKTLLLMIRRVGPFKFRGC